MIPGNRVRVGQRFKEDGVLFRKRAPPLSEERIREQLELLRLRKAQREGGRPVTWASCDRAYYRAIRKGKDLSPEIREIYNKKLSPKETEKELEKLLEKEGVL